MMIAVRNLVFIFWEMYEECSNMMFGDTFSLLTWTLIRIKSCNVVIDAFLMSARHAMIFYAKRVCEFCISCEGTFVL